MHVTWVVYRVWNVKLYAQVFLQKATNSYINIIYFLKKSQTCTYLKRASFLIQSAVFFWRGLFFLLGFYFGGNYFTSGYTCNTNSMTRSQTAWRVRRQQRVKSWQSEERFRSLSCLSEQVAVNVRIFQSWTRIFFVLLRHGNSIGHTAKTQVPAINVPLGRKRSRSVVTPFSGESA